MNIEGEAAAKEQARLDSWKRLDAIRNGLAEAYAITVRMKRDAKACEDLLTRIETGLVDAYRDLEEVRIQKILKRAEEFAHGQAPEGEPVNDQAAQGSDGSHAC